MIRRAIGLFFGSSINHEMGAFTEACEHCGRLRTVPNAARALLEKDQEASKLFSIVDQGFQLWFVARPSWSSGTAGAVTKAQNLSFAWLDWTGCDTALNIDSCVASSGIKNSAEELARKMVAFAEKSEIVLVYKPSWIILAFDYFDYQ